ncbi:hypothetical protein MW084_17840, partial [Streptomyces sudanensis]
MPRYDAPPARRAADAFGAAAAALAAVLLAVLGVLAPASHAAPAAVPPTTGAQRPAAADDPCAAVCSAAPLPSADVAGLRSVPPPLGAAPG